VFSERQVRSTERVAEIDLGKRPPEKQGASQS
jgi:hypothetical protein